MSDITERIEYNMPGIEVLQYVREPMKSSVRDEIIKIVHDVLEEVVGKRPSHSNFRYTPAAYLDVSGFDYILVVDGEWNWRTWLRKKKIRLAIKESVATAMNIDRHQIAVRYRIYNSSFG